MEGSRNCMFAVLELMLSWLVAVVRLLQCNVVQVVAFFFLSALCLIVLYASKVELQKQC